MRASPSIIGSVLLAGLLGGCYPAIVRTSPRFVGSLKADGVPVPHAKVFVQPGSVGSCNVLPVSTVTNEQGSFVVPVRRKLQWKPIILLGDPVSGWRVCFEHDGQYYLGHQELTGGWVPESVQLECDLAAEPVLRPQGPRPGEICRNLMPGRDDEVQ